MKYETTITISREEVENLIRVALLNQGIEAGAIKFVSKNEISNASSVPRPEVFPFPSVKWEPTTFTTTLDKVVVEVKK